MVEQQRRSKGRTMRFGLDRVRYGPYRIECLGAGDSKEHAAQHGKPRPAAADLPRKTGARRVRGG
jgi:hypothetical protein